MLEQSDSCQTFLFHTLVYQYALHGEKKGPYFGEIYKMRAHVMSCMLAITIHSQL